MIGRPAKRAPQPAALAPSTLPRSAQEIEVVVARCRQRVTRHALLSAGAAVVPLPAFDLAVDVAVLTRLLQEVNEAFGLTPAQIAALAPQRRFTVYRAIDTLGASAAGRLITREVVALLARSVARRVATKTTLRYVPLAGQALAATISFAALKTLGERHIRDCEQVVREVIGCEPR